MSKQNALNPYDSIGPDTEIDDSDLVSAGGYLGEDYATVRNLIAANSKVIFQPFLFQGDINYGWLGVNVAGTLWEYSSGDAEQYDTADYSTFHARGGVGVAAYRHIQWYGETGPGGADTNFDSFSPAGGGLIDLYVANTAHDNLLVGDLYAAVSANSGPDKFIYATILVRTSPIFTASNSPWSVAER